MEDLGLGLGLVEETTISEEAAVGEAKIETTTMPMEAQVCLGECESLPTSAQQYVLLPAISIFVYKRPFHRNHNTVLMVLALPTP